MADESTEEKKPEEQNRNLLILKSKPDGLKSAETFLTNRSWKLHSTSELKPLLAAMFKEKPYSVVISLDHPSPKVMKLYLLVEQALKIPVIVCCEQNNAVRIKKLGELNHPYTIYPPVSGPAIERILLKIERDKLDPKLVLGRQKPTTSATGGADTLTISTRAGAGGTDGTAVQSSFNARDELVKLFEGERSDQHQEKSGSIHTSTKSQAEQEGGPEFVGLGLKQGQTNTSGPAYHPSQSGQNGHSGNFTNSDSVQNSANANSTENGAGYTINPNGSSGHNPNNLSNGTNNDWGWNQESAWHTQEKNAANEQDKSPLAAKPNTDGQSSEGDEFDFEKSRSAIHDALARSEHRKDVPIFEQVPDRPVTFFESKIENAKQKSESMIIRGTEMALQQSVKVKQGSSIKKVNACQRVSCFRVQAGETTGLLIAAFGDQREADEAFNASVRKLLVQFMQNNGLSFSADNVMNLKIEEVSFESWSMKEASFLRKAVHDGTEVALAFFPYDFNETPLECSVNEEMLKFSLSEIRTHQALEFDLYLYMPTNGKYIRYTGKEREMFESQKSRLTQKGVKEFHIHKTNETDVTKYRLKNFLNDKIAEFKTKKTG